jgi:hypothetical protein
MRFSALSSLPTHALSHRTRVHEQTNRRTSKAADGIFLSVKLVLCLLGTSKRVTVKLLKSVHFIFELVRLAPNVVVGRRVHLRLELANAVNKLLVASGLITLAVLLACGTCTGTESTSARTWFEQLSIAFGIHLHGLPPRPSAERCGQQSVVGRCRRARTYLFHRHL